MFEKHAAVARRRRGVPTQIELVHEAEKIKTGIYRQETATRFS